MSRRPRALYLLSAEALDGIYGESQRAAIDELAELVAPPQTSDTVAQHMELLEDVEVIVSGWGMPVVDAAFLAHAPRLRAILYGAGSVRGFVTDALWEREIQVTSAQAGNAEPVADFTAAAVVLALKGAWRLAAAARADRRLPSREGVRGVWGATVGVISLGLVGRLVCRRLGPLGVHLLAHDPFVSRQEAAELGAEPAALEALFDRASVVTVHAPLLPETAGMVTGALVDRLPEGGALINTARGAVVREAELIEVLRRRPDLTAILDVTDPEPPAPGSSLYTLPNVVLTPHIAGALGEERRRLGQLMVEELRRYVGGEPLRFAVSRERLSRSATP